MALGDPFHQLVHQARACRGGERTRKRIASAGILGYDCLGHNKETEETSMLKRPSASFSPPVRSASRRRPNFRLEDYAVPTPGDGQVLLRTIWLSLDPYMRGRMSEGPSYAAPVPVDGVMEGGTVCEVIASNNPGFAKGDIVLSHAGWQTPRAVGRQGAAQDRSEARRRSRPRSACSACRA